MAAVRRVAGWAVFLAALVALGALIHATAPPVERWRAKVDGEEAKVKLGGGRVILLPRAPAAFSVLEATTGAQTGQFGADDGEVEPDAWAAGRWLIWGGLGDPVLRWADVTTGAKHRLDVGTTVSAVVIHPEEAVAYAAVLDGNEIPRSLRRIDLNTATSLPLTGRFANRAAATLPHDLRPLTRGKVAFREGNPQSSAVVFADARGKRLAQVSLGNRTHVISKDATVLFIFGFGDQPAEMWDVRDPERPARLMTTPVAEDEFFSVDWASGYATRVGAAAGGETPLVIWDRQGNRRQVLVKAALTSVLGVSSDGRWAVAWMTLPRPSGAAGLIDLESGACVAEVRSSDTTEPRLLPAEGGGYGMLVHFDGHDDFHDPTTGRVHRLPGRIPERGAKRLERAGQLWRAGTAEPKLSAEWWERWLAWFRPPETDLLVGLQWPSRRPLLQLANARVTDYAVAPDGSFVITAHDAGSRTVVRRWDLPQPKPWLRIVGTPLAVGAALLGLRAWVGAKKGVPDVPAPAEER